MPQSRADLETLVAGYGAVRAMGAGYSYFGDQYCPVPTTTGSLQVNQVFMPQTRSIYTNGTKAMTDLVNFLGFPVFGPDCKGDRPVNEDAIRIDFTNRQVFVRAGVPIRTLLDFMEM